MTSYDHEPFPYKSPVGPRIFASPQAGRCPKRKRRKWQRWQRDAGETHRWLWRAMGCAVGTCPAAMVS